VSVVPTSRTIPREVIELCRALADKGYRAWVVGGCLRDLLLGRSAADWDLATDAQPEQVKEVFPKVLPTGIEHGTVTVRHRGKSYEVTTLRGEGAYSDGRRPDAVHFVTNVEEDLSRRDFTINAMAFDPLSDVLTDPFDGRGDLARSLIRAVGEPERRFSEDGLRVLRAARFCATLEFELEAATEAAIPGTLETFRKVSAERVRDEWMKALRARQPSRAFLVMKRTGILAHTLPELVALPEERFARSLLALDDAPRAEPVLRLSALLWPLAQDLGRVDAWLASYRFSNQERERVARCLRFVEPERAAPFSPLELRRWAHAVGRPYVAEVSDLNARLARAHQGADSAAYRSAAQVAQDCARLLESDTALAQKELRVTGKDLMAALELAPGPRVGALLQRLMADVLEDPALNQRELLLDRARSALTEFSS
jgi:tRNA nucleotidyltransferase (CCA-adding enzyme)